MKQEDIEIIEEYLLGRLVKEQCLELEKRLAADDEFKETFEFVKSLQKAVNHSAKEEFKSGLKEIAAEYAESRKIPIPIESFQKATLSDDAQVKESRDKKKKLFNLSWKSLSIAAVFAGLIATSLILILKDKPHLNHLPPALAEFNNSKKHTVLFKEEKITDADYLKNLARRSENEYLLPTKIEKNFLVAIIDDKNTVPSYYYSDTLYLIGHFENIQFLYYEADENDQITLFLRDGLRNYSLLLEKNEKIIPLIKFTNFPNIDTNE
jgi:anti-sigma-K factor RskA